MHLNYILMMSKLLFATTTMNSKDFLDIAFCLCCSVCTQNNYFHVLYVKNGLYSFFDKMLFA